jgi:hypothetical protein
MDALESLAQAIARQESNYGTAGRAAVNNNPGNLRDYRKPDGSWAIWPALAHDDAGFPRFASMDAGWAALRRDLALKAARGMTLEQIIYAWAPPKENNTAAYLQDVVAWTGLTPAARITAGTPAPAGGAPSGPAAGGGSLPAGRSDAWAVASGWIPAELLAGDWLEDDAVLMGAAAVGAVAVGAMLLD